MAKVDHVWLSDADMTEPAEFGLQRTMGILPLLQLHVRHWHPQLPVRPRWAMVGMPINSSMSELGLESAQDVLKVSHVWLSELRPR